MTYRAAYVREGRARSVTFAAYGYQHAMQWAYGYCQRVGAQLQTVTALRPRLDLS